METVVCWSPPEADRLGVTGCTVKYSSTEYSTVSSKCQVVVRSPTSTVSSGSGTGVVTIGTISGSDGGKATLRPSPSGGVVD